MSIKPRPIPDSSSSAATKSRTLSVFEDLRTEILQMQLAPGSRLLVASLAERFGVSQTGVREALSRLVAEGLVKAIDQRGFRVSSVSMEDLRDTSQTRIDIETLAIRRSIERGDAAWEGRLLGVYHELSKATPARVEDLQDQSPSWGTLHKRFHHALLSECGSPWLLRFWGTLFDQSERYRKLSVAHPVGPRNVNREHKLIVEAAIARDADKAVELLGHHFNRTTQIVLKTMASGPLADSGG